MLNKMIKEKQARRINDILLLYSVNWTALSWKKNNELNELKLLINLASLFFIIIIIIKTKYENND